MGNSGAWQTDAQGKSPANQSLNRPMAKSASRGDLTQRLMVAKLFLASSPQTRIDMTEPFAEHQTDALERPVSRKNLRDPGRYVCPWKPFSGVMIAGSALLLGAGFLLAQRGGLSWVVAYILFTTTIGLMFTLAATAWGAMISLTESPQCGALFLLFPPYMAYYGITRWRWMAQPSILFLCGLGLVIGSILTGWHLLAQLAVLSEAT